MNDESFDFSKALAEIQEINRWFQSDDIPLEEALVKLKRGMELIKKCSTRLKDVENEFIELKKQHGIQGNEQTDTETPLTEETDDSDKVPF